MIFPLSDVSAVVVSIAVWPLIGWFSGLWFSRRPAQQFAHASWLTRPRSFERSGRFYRRGLRIHRWKDLVPEQGSLFEGGYSKARLSDRSTANLERFVKETRRAELVHWVNLAAGPFFLIWCPPAIGAVMVGFGVIAHLPFIAIQRYNRGRLIALVARRQARREPQSASRTPATSPERQ